MKILIYDTETTEIHRGPRVIQLGWILAEQDGTVLNQQNHLIKPDGWVVPKLDFWVKNGFSTYTSARLGKPIAEVLGWFISDESHADLIVGHNISFDQRMLNGETTRLNLARKGLPTFCTMHQTAKIVWLPSKAGSKKPKLQELYQHLFGKPFAGAHDAGADVMATKESFFELIKRGHFDLNLLCGGNNLPPLSRLTPLPGL